MNLARRRRRGLDHSAGRSAEGAGRGGRRHVLARLTPAVDPLIYRILVEETRAVIRPDRQYDAIDVHERGVILQAAGRRFESAAEIRHFQSIGGDLVTMNVGTEVSYARQAGIDYACLVVISNPAEGLGAWGCDMLPAVYGRQNPVCLEIVKRAVVRAAKLPDEGRVGEAACASIRR